MEESYWESMKSGVADMVNTGGRPGGAITAALFLKQVEDLIIPSNCFPSCERVSECMISTGPPLTVNIVRNQENS